MAKATCVYPWKQNRLYYQTEDYSWKDNLKILVLQKYLILCEMRYNLCNLKKHEKHPWMKVTFSKVEAFNTPPWVFLRFLNCTNSTTLCKVSHIITVESTCPYYTTIDLSKHAYFYNLEIKAQLSRSSNEKGKLLINLKRINKFSLIFINPLSLDE